MLLKRYSNIEYILNLEQNLGFLFLCKAIEKNNEEIIFNRWIHDVGAQYNGLSFDEYKKKLLPYRKSTIKEKEEILSKYGQGG